MIVVAAVLLVVVVGVIVVVGAAGLAATDRGVKVALPTIGIVAVVLLLVLVVGMFGLGGLRSAPGSGEESAIDPVVEPISEEPVALDGPSATFDGRVAVDAHRSPLRPLPLVGGLQAGDVIEVSGEGFLEHAEGAVAQCARVGAQTCRNVLRVLTDGGGRLRVPFRVEGPSSGEVLVVEVDFARGAGRLGFGTRAADPTRLTLEQDGTRVAVRNAPAGETVAILRCPPDVGSIDDCDAVAEPTVAADGTTAARLENRGATGSVLALLDAEGAALAVPVRIPAAAQASTEVELDPARLGGGIAVAIALIGIAIGFIRTTDWRVPSEASTPFLDAATFDA